MSIRYTRDNIYNIINQLETARDITAFCRSNLQIYELCQKDQLIHQLIISKRIHFYENMSNPRYTLLNAIEAGDLEVVNELLNMGFKLIGDELIRAIERNNLPIFERILKDPRVDPSDRYDFPLKKAILKNNPEIVKILLKDQRVNPDKELFMLAVMLNEPEIINLLLDYVKPNFDDNQAIITASFNGYTDIVDLLLKDETVDPTARNNLAITYASINNRIPIVKRLLNDKRVLNSLYNELKDKYLKQLHK